MGIQKRETHYLLLLALCIVAYTHIQTAADKTCEINNRNNKTCQAKGGFVQEVDANGSCISSQCIASVAAKIKFFAFRFKVKELSPSIARSKRFPIQTSTPFNLICRAWARPNKALELVSFTSSTKPALPTASGRRLYIMQGPFVIATMCSVSLPMQLTEARHKQTVTCGMSFGALSKANATERTRTASDSLYAFKQTRPFIKGTSQVESGQTGRWACVTEQVTADSLTQFTTTLSTKPASDNSSVPQRTVERLGHTLPPSFKVTVVMSLRVPLTFKPAFFVECQTKNVVLGPKKPVTMTAELVRVEVIMKPLDLSNAFTIIAISFGLGGLLIGIALFIYYWRKKNSGSKRQNLMFKDHEVFFQKFEESLKTPNFPEAPISSSVDSAPFSGTKLSSAMKEPEFDPEMGTLPPSLVVSEFVPPPPLPPVPPSAVALPESSTEQEPSSPPPPPSKPPAPKPSPQPPSKSPPSKPSPLPPSIMETDSVTDYEPPEPTPLPPFKPAPPPSKMVKGTVAVYHPPPPSIKVQESSSDPPSLDHTIKGTGT